MRWSLAGLLLSREASLTAIRVCRLRLRVMDAVFVGVLVLGTLGFGAGALVVVRRLARVDRHPVT